MLFLETSPVIAIAFVFFLFNTQPLNYSDQSEKLKFLPILFTWFILKDDPIGCELTSQCILLLDSYQKKFWTAVNFWNEKKANFYQKPRKPDFSESVNIGEQPTSESNQWVRGILTVYRKYTKTEQNVNEKSKVLVQNQNPVLKHTDTKSPNIYIDDPRSLNNHHWKLDKNLGNFCLHHIVELSRIEFQLDETIVPVLTRRGTSRNPQKIWNSPINQKEIQF